MDFRIPFPGTEEQHNAALFDTYSILIDWQVFLSALYFIGNNLLRI